jgi:hypothetical protein
MTETEALEALHELEVQYPHLEIWIGTRPGARVWFARGRNGTGPYLVMSDDLDRFRRMLAA